MERREFLKKLAALKGGIILFSADKEKSKISNFAGKYPALTDKSKVVFCRDENVRASNKGLNRNIISAMLDNMIKEIYNVSSPRDGWRQVVKPGDTVGIKINCLAGKGASTHNELVHEIIEKVIEAGVSKNKIIIWDRMDEDLKRGGYRLNYRGNGPLCMGNNAVGYEEEITINGSIGSQLSKIVTKYCSAVINVPVLKDHGIVGYTGALKNYFGAINNPNKYHDNFGDPFIADLNTIDVIRKKTRITIMDALSTQYEGGPAYLPYWSWNSNCLGVSHDMVALDYACWQIVEKKRKEEGIQSLKEAGREPGYILTAADKYHKLGNAHPDNIEIKYI